MAAPTITHDFTTFNAAETDPGSGWGQNNAKWDIDGDIEVEGDYCLACAPFQTGDGGNGYTGTAFDATSNYILVWVYVVTSGFVNAYSSAGVYVRVATGADWTSNYNDYYVGGNDVTWVGRGWHLVCLDANRSPDRSAGSVDLANATRVGVGFNCALTSSKSSAIAFDAIRYGTSFEVTGSISTTSPAIGFAASGNTISRDAGSFTTDGYASGDIIYVRNSAYNDGRYTVDTVGTTTMTVNETLIDETETSGITIDAVVGLQDIIDWDEGATTRYYGVVTKNPLGAFEINAPLTLGDVSGSNRLAFDSSDEVVYFADQPMDVATTDLGITTAEDSGAVTMAFFGQSVGTGDSRVGFSGPIYTLSDDVFAGLPYFDFSANITELGIFGVVALSLGGGVTLPNVSGGGDHYVTTTTFSQCGQVDPGTAECRGLTFAGYAGAADGALLWSDDIDIKNSNFLSNTRAVEHPDYSGSPYTYTGLVFAGNTYDVNNSSGAGITINTPGTSNPSTYTGSSVSFASTVTLTVLVQDADRNALELIQTSIYLLDSPFTELMNEDTDSDGIATEQYGGSTPVDVVVKTRKSETTDSPRYYATSSIQTIGSGGLSVTVTKEVSRVL